MAPSSERTVVLVNPEAGGGQAVKIARAARDYLAEVGYPADFEEAASAEELRQKAREAVAAGCRHIVALGGDGTVHHVINAVRQAPQMAEAETGMVRRNDAAVAFGIIPCGSGDDFADNLGLPRDPLAASNVLLKGRVRRVDAAEIAGEVYACIGGIGLDSMANRIANEAPSWLRGQWRYLLAALRVLPDFRPMRFELRVDGKKVTGEMTSVLVANARSFGSGFRVAPRARLDDGLLDVCLFRAMSRARMMEVLPQAVRGEHLSLPEVEYFQGREIAIQTDPPGDYYADGDFMARSPVKIRVLDKALPILVPPQGEAP